jgi:aminoglycoside 6'-N-acetyltransferase I
MSPPCAVRLPTSEDAEQWALLREAVWPELSDEEHREEMMMLLEEERAEVFVAAAPDGQIVGFVEVALRTWAEGCTSSPVAYVEGWYVVPAARGKGVGAALVAAAEEWALSRDCLEMASDADALDEGRRRHHHRLGYQEVGHLVHFRKRLRAGGTGGALAPPGEAYET